MCRYFAILICILNSIAILGQDTYFSKLYEFEGTNSTDWGFSILLSESGYIINGSYTFANKPSRAGLIKLDLNGEIVKRVNYGNSQGRFYISVPKSLIQVCTSGYLTVGNYDNGSKDFGFAMKVNTNLDSIWTRFYGDSISPEYTGLILRSGIQTPDSGFMLVGDTWIEGYNVNLVLIKTDSLGNQQWLRKLGPDGYHVAYNVELSADGGYYIGGLMQYLGYPSHPILMKVDSGGNALWYKNLGGTVQEDVAVVKAMPDSGCVAVAMHGKKDEYNSDIHRIRAFRFRPDGSTVWQKDFGVWEQERYMNDLIRLDNGNFLASGYYTHVDYIQNCFYTMTWLLSFTPDGDSLWYREYAYNWEQNWDQRLYGLAQAPDGGIAACGWVQHLVTNGSCDCWVMKLDSLGCEGPGQCWVGINETAPPAPPTVAGAELCLQPNPASGHFTAQLPQLPAPNTSLSLTDLTGRLLRQWPLTQQATTLSCEGLPPGLYFASLTQGGKTIATSKLIVQ